MKEQWGIVDKSGDKLAELGITFTAFLCSSANISTI